MKRFFAIAIICLFTTLTYAQENHSEFVEKGDMVYATYYYDNGQIEQQGTFNLKGKLHGEWISYDVKGKKISVGHYENGLKTGKWLFWTNGIVREVIYEKSKIIEVNEWKDNQI